MVYAKIDGEWAWWTVEAGSPVERVSPQPAPPPTPAPNEEMVYSPEDGGWMQPSWF